MKKRAMRFDDAIEELRRRSDYNYHLSHCAACQPERLRASIIADAYKDALELMEGISNPPSDPLDE